MARCSESPERSPLETFRMSRAACENACLLTGTRRKPDWLKDTKFFHAPCARFGSISPRRTLSDRALANSVKIQSEAISVSSQDSNHASTASLDGSETNSGMAALVSR
jgi:hypothetical protein